MDLAILRYAFGAGCVASAAFVFWPQVALWRQRTKTPVCGRCGQPVAAASGVACPGCGADLRLAGILTPDMVRRRPASLLSVQIGWTLLWCLIGCGAVLMVESLPGQRIDVRGNAFAPVDPASPERAPLPFAFDIESTSWAWFRPARNGQVTLRLSSAANTQAAGVVTMSWPERSIVSTSGSASLLKTGAPFTPDALADWLRRAGLPVDASPQFAGELNVLIASTAAAGPAIASVWVAAPGQSRSSLFIVTPAWIQPALAGAMLALWPLGAAIVVRRFRKPAPTARPHARTARPAHAN